MSRKHPIVAVTGSSGAGTTNVKLAFEHVFRREGIQAAVIEGDSFHRYDRKEMEQAVARGKAAGRATTHFGPDGNLFEELEALFREYGASGTGRRRRYVHNDEDAQRYGYPPGSLTPWELLPDGTDLLLYEGLHGGLVCDTADVARHVELLIGVVPIINLEWIQKIHRDKAERGYTASDATNMILDRMYDYVHYITPQFSRTDINFQRVPTVDTSNPFAADGNPPDEYSFYVIHVRNLEKIDANFPYLLQMLEGSFQSSADTIVVPADKKVFAMQILFNPVIRRLMRARQD